MTSQSHRDTWQTLDRFDTGSGAAQMFRLTRLEDNGLCQIARLPYSIRVLLEAVLRNCDGSVVTEDDVKNLAGWTGQPAAVDLDRARGVGDQVEVPGRVVVAAAV